MQQSSHCDWSQHLSEKHTAENPHLTSHFSVAAAFDLWEKHKSHLTSKPGWWKPRVRWIKISCHGNPILGCGELRVGGNGLPYRTTDSFFPHFEWWCWSVNLMMTLVCLQRDTDCLFRCINGRPYVKIHSDHRHSVSFLMLHKQRSDIKKITARQLSRTTFSEDYHEICWCVTCENDISTAYMYDGYTVKTLLSYRKLIMRHAHSLLWW